MLSFLSRPKQLLDDDIIQWLFDCYDWTLEEFDKDVFYNETTLAIPDNKHFPGKETSAEGMAELIFSQVKQFAGMSHWPTKLYNVELGNVPIPPNHPIQIKGPMRSKNVELPSNEPVASSPFLQTAMSFSSMPQPDNKIAVRYLPQQLRSPQGIISHFAHDLSFHLATTAKSQPPGGEDYLPMAVEVLAIYMGFGIVFANSAVVPRTGGCGGCGGGQSPVRQVILSEEEATYALAIFCHLKNLDGKDAKKHLKKHLRGFFKDAMVDVKRRLDKKSVS